MTNPQLAALFAQLDDPSSPKRRAAAKKLRKLGQPQACRPLMEALRKELEKKVTWETQYQIIMALGESGCKECLPLLDSLAHEHRDFTMVLTAIGDAIVRLERETPDDPRPVFRVLSIPNDPAVWDGALRAMAMLRMKFTEDTAAQLIPAVEQIQRELIEYWPAAAAAGWSGPEVERFLRNCANSPKEELREVAKSSLAGKYLKHNPL